MNTYKCIGAYEGDSEFIIKPSKGDFVEISNYRYRVMKVIITKDEVILELE